MMYNPKFADLKLVGVMLDKYESQEDFPVLVFLP